MKWLSRSDVAYANFVRVFALTVALTGCVQEPRPLAQGEQLTVEIRAPFRFTKKAAVSPADRADIERIVAGMDAARREQDPTP